MLPLVFLGGALVGAAGLVAAALHDDKKTEAAFSPLLKAPEALTEDEVASLLGDYALKANLLSIKISQVGIESAALQGTSIELPDDGMFQKIANSIGDGLTKTARHLRCNELENLKDEASKLYGRYRGVFRRANALLRERGRTPIDLRGLTLSKAKVSVNNAIENENWCFDFEDAEEGIRSFLEKSSEIAEQFIAIFEGREKILALGEGDLPVLPS